MKKSDVTLKEAKTILGDITYRMSDEEILFLMDSLKSLARAYVNMVLNNKI